MSHSPRREFGLGQIAIFCMIPDPERKALVEALQANGAQPRPARGSFDGWLLTIDGQEVEVVLRRMRGQGNTEAAIATLGGLFQQAPRFIILCGIAGGMQIRKVRLGDVVIASDVAYRGFNKITGDDLTAQGLHLRPVTLETGARPGAGALVDRFFEAGLKNLAYAKPPISCVVHHERILSWDLVLDHEPTKQNLLREVDGNLVAVEMEAGGFLKAVAYYQHHLASAGGKVDALIVRGISDAAANKEQSDRDTTDWRWTAARNAAEVVLRLIKMIRQSDLLDDPDHLA